MADRRARQRRLAGITLVEVMVAVTILAMVTLMVWSGFSQTARTKRELSEVLDRSHAIHSAMGRMAREISMAYVSAQRNPDPNLRAMITAFVGVDHGERDRLDFNSFSHRRLYRNAHESDQNELSYFLAPNPEDGGRGYVLARRQQSRPDDAPGRGGEVQVLLEGVEELQFEYLDPVSMEWLDTWNSDPDAADAQRNRLPAQVKIRVVVVDLDDPDETATYATRAVIQLTWALNHAVYNP